MEKLNTEPSFDAALAKRLGADQMGMRSYVLVVLKSGPNKVAPGKERDEMFSGHFANMQTLAKAGKLVLAGPFDGKDGWRGLFIFAVASIDEARELTNTDPVIQKGEMVAEYHQWYGSAAVMEVSSIHARLTPPKAETEAHKK
ncbi:YciI family protein [Undibacterium cyanobacteriorum]|uniref:YciI family protein n=1 Tax=Undibacterium cyanobacteriorum TaxID=3073561 RepID=A0ABY9RK83_9BURK|nr:YciI family protein [Undibacterium sp. 20NA77.5]WMW81361.1 YciI family protein [Undibacterium sp. 20NA77.5]